MRYVPFPDYANSAAELRRQAERHERLARAAEKDGDRLDALENRNKAARLRKLARQQEIQ